MSKILYHEENLIGTANQEGVFFPLGTKCKGSIANRIFAPRWVEEAWAQGLEVFVEDISLRKNDRGRFYAVIRGKAGVDKVEREEVTLSGDYFYHESVYTSGKTRSRGSFPLYNWRNAPDWVKKHPEYEKIVREYRLNKVIFNRYVSPYLPSKPFELRGGAEVVKTVEKISDDLTSIKVGIALKYEGAYLGYYVKDGKIARSEQGTTIKIESYVSAPYIPIEEVYDVKRIPRGTEFHVTTYTSSEYESSDGRGTRSDSSTYLTQYEYTEVVLIPKVDWAPRQSRMMKKVVFEIPMHELSEWRGMLMGY